MIPKSTDRGEANRGVKNTVAALVSLALIILAQHLFVAGFRYGVTKDEARLSQNGATTACAVAASRVCSELLVGAIMLIVVILSTTVGRALVTVNVYLRPVVILPAVGIVVWLGAFIYLQSGGLLINDSLLRLLEDTIQSLSGC